MAFRRLGEICGEYLSRGKQVYIEGRLQTRSWEKDGVTRYSTEIVAEDMQMLDSKGSGGAPADSFGSPDDQYSAYADTGSGGAASSSSPDSGGGPAGGASDVGDDIPF